VKQKEKKGGCYNKLIIQLIKVYCHVLYIIPFFTNLTLFCPSFQTGKSKHFGFLEFASPEVKQTLIYSWIKF